MLVVRLERGADHAGRCTVHEYIEWPELGHLRCDRRGRDVAADEHGLGTALAQLVRHRLGGLVVSHVADRDARRAFVREAQSDLAADPP